MKLIERIFSSPRARPIAVPPHLAWVDEFIANVRPYVFVRTEDNILIKRPNRAQKLNAWGARVLKALLDGATVRDVLEGAGGRQHPERADQIAQFMCAIKRSLEGGVNETTAHPAVEHVPFTMNFSQLPVLSEIALSYACNLRCRFCYAGCGSPLPPSGRRMTPLQVKRVLEIIYHEAKVPSVSFTGGEPTAVPELAGYVRHASRLGMRVNLVTNGTLVDERMAGVLADAGLDSAQVSIEGVSARTHDTLVDEPGAFERSLRGARALHTAGVATHTNTTLCTANAAEAPGLPAFIRDRLGFERFSMNLIIPTGSVDANRELVIRYAEAGSLIDTIEAASVAAGVEFMWYSPLPMCLYNTVAHGMGNRGCAACDGLLSVAPDGGVLPCASVPASVGNLLREPFARVWASARACTYRDKSLAPERCRICDDFHICNGACFLYWQAMGEGELACAAAPKGECDGTGC